MMYQAAALAASTAPAFCQQQKSFDSWTIDSAIVPHFVSDMGRNQDPSRILIRFHSR